jgi:hypothetical protein
MFQSLRHMNLSSMPLSEQRRKYQRNAHEGYGNKPVIVEKEFCEGEALMHPQSHVDV